MTYLWTYWERSVLGGPWTPDSQQKTADPTVRIRIFCGVPVCPNKVGNSDSVRLLIKRTRKIVNLEFLKSRPSWEFILNSYRNHMGPHRYSKDYIIVYIDYILAINWSVDDSPSNHQIRDLITQRSLNFTYVFTYHLVPYDIWNALSYLGVHSQMIPFSFWSPLAILCIINPYL